MDKKYIYYLGEQNLLKDSFLKIKSQNPNLPIALRFVQFRKDKTLIPIFTKLIESPPHVIFIESVDFNKNLRNFLILIKSHSKLEKTFTFIVFQGKETFQESQKLYLFNADYGLIQGAEMDKILLDAIYLAIDKNITLPQYAIAEKLSFNAEMMSLCKVSQLSNDSIYLETYQTIDNGSIIEIDLDTEENIKFAKVFLTDSFQPRSNLPHSLVARLLFKNSRELNSLPEEKTSNLCSKASYLRYLPSIKKESCTGDVRILLFDKRIETFTDVMDILDNKDYFFKIQDHLGKNEKIIELFTPGLIIIQKEETEENEDNIFDDSTYLHSNTGDVIRIMVDQIRRIRQYTPVLAVFNEETSQEQYRKNVGYNNVVTYKEDFKKSFLPDLLKNHRKPHKKDKTGFYLNPLEEISFARIHLDVIITSLSEHTITFFYKNDLPLFSTYELPSFRNLYLRIIPSPRHLPRKGDYRHYMAIITNSTEKDKMEMRKLVNYLMFLPENDRQKLELKSVEKLRGEYLERMIRDLEKKRNTQLNQLQKKE